MPIEKNRAEKKGKIRQVISPLLTGLLRESNDKVNHTFQCCFLTSWIHLHCTNTSDSKNYKFNDTLIVENRNKEDRKHIFIIYLTKQQVHVDIFKNVFSSDFSKANHLFDSLLTRAFL